MKNKILNSGLRITALKLHDKITGRKILSRLEELNQTQWLSRDELEALQRKKLQYLVDYAYKYVPYYRRTFDQIGFHPNDLQKDLSNFSKLPILTKAIIRENFNDLLITETNYRKELSQLFTSGSTGNPLSFMQDSNYRDYVTADIQRHMGWAGWNLGDSQALIWGTKLNRTIGQKTRAHMIDTVWNRFHLNAFQMSEEKMALFAKKILKQKPKILFGYATCIDQFARFIRNFPKLNINFDGIFTTAEVLLPSSRIFIEDTFQCKIFNRYGTLELGGIACECHEHTGLHISVENNYVEILENGTPIDPGNEGELIVTNLNNFGMPFIRYSIGDLGSLMEYQKCTCGRNSIKLTNICGRLTEMFLTKDGRMVRAAFSGGFNCLSHPSIKQFQVVQKTIDRIVVRLVPYGEIPKSVLNEITKTINKAFGEDIKVDFEIVNKISLLPSGKHQYAVSELNKLDIPP